ncbi:MAG: lipopolysaccharide biosynthesis protein [Lachnospiraceae bacterium]|jgi:Membrane protein involved in the export of O-antigen and teichoic acid|nr:lipopolysaccharide biosynthesis protein [Lachnospiraceae bacterium]MCI8826665.1 lipopolysaccharide biosynthesis protein [Lachnospiraceae bacterium]MCI9370631.1 lipopolysaccharide biosynthesis protein [Lachnospiraceae bacterium]
MDENRKIFSNLIWRFLERSGAQFVSFIVSLVLARILMPEDYGTIALITVFTTILQVFVDSGLGNALIQKKDADDLDFSTVFFANIVFCTVLYALMFVAAPAISRFYGDMFMVSYIRVLSLTVLISGIKNVQQAYVSRHMMFKKFFFSTLGGTVLAGIIGIVMALNKMGVWALVAQQVINMTIDTIILWITVKWKPHLKFSFSRMKGLFSFGWKLLVSSLIDSIYNDLRQLIIGKMYSSADLAYYNKAKQFPNLIVTNINTSIDSVLLPAMSNVQDNKEHVKSMTRRSIKTSIYVMAPLMMGMAFAAKPIISLLLTDKWLLCVPFVRIFCITYMFYPIHTANLNAMKAMGRSDLFLKLEIIKKVFGLVLLLSTMWFGIMAMAYSLLVSSLFGQIINSWPNRKLLNYGYLEQLKDILPGIGLAVVMGGCIYFVGLFPLPIILILIIQVVSGALIYITLSAALHLESFEYLLKILKNNFKKIIKKR